MLDLSQHIERRITDAEILLIGCSAGGFSLVFDMVTYLPGGFPLPVIVVMHRGKNYRSSVEALLQQKSQVRVKLAEDKEQIRRNTVYFAPANYHVLAEPEKMLSLDASEPEHYCRPSIDVTFKSVADVYGSHVIAVLLSGANADGAGGLCYIAGKNGLSVIQNPEVAEVRIMPQAALDRCNPDLILDNEALFELLDKIAILHNIKL
ncbi:chemotaxis protein CheB [Pedobacter sp. BS3]|uniref:chemotaxis protein CheB n=1 Tax=Pedobacter sp. BS3 TaxID=2567937 RepID=UPI0011EDC56A|nr:chemotaxis protein CheB [Pedobacter sp. BS3]TZF84032.1 chemotaxis protein CheB [Pedobacter sp. BS3]